MKRVELLSPAKNLETAIAAIKLNRNYIGIEKNEDYIQISKILISEMQKSGI